MLIRDAISQVFEDLGVSSDDTTLSWLYVYNTLKNISKELLRQEVEKKGMWPNIPMQTLHNFELKQTDFSEVEEFRSGIVTYRSVKKMPILLDTKEGKILGGVYLSTGKRIDVTSLNYILNSSKRRYSSGDVMATFRNDHIYLFNVNSNSDILYVSIDGVYEDPEEVEALNSKECDTGCIYYPDLQFYIPGYLSSRMFRMAKSDIAFKLGIPTDETNNAKSDTVGQMKQQPQAQQN